jgi:hypothetical protein
MKTTILNCGLLAALIFLGACSTIDMFVSEDENLYAELEMNDPARVTLTLNNRGEEELALDRFYYTGKDGRGRLKGLDETLTAPLRLAPGDRQSRSFALEEALSREGDKLKIAPWVAEDNSGDRFDLVYSVAGEEYPLSFPDRRERVLAGRVKVSLDIALPFRYTVAERRQMIYDMALSQAQSSLGGEGKKLRLVNLRYDSTSNGFSEKAVLSADVIAGD